MLGDRDGSPCVKLDAWCVVLVERLLTSSGSLIYRTPVTGQFRDRYFVASLGAEPYRRKVTAPRGTGPRGRRAASNGLGRP